MILPLPHRSRGFTYLGLMIVVAILGIASVATVMVGSLLQRRAQEEELLYIGRQFRLAFQKYYDAIPAGQRRYPAKLEDLVRDPRFPQPRRHLRKVFIDPMTGKPDWGIVEAPGGGLWGVYSLSEEKPIKVAQFDTEFATLEGKSKYSEWVFGYAPLPLRNPQQSQPPQNSPFSQPPSIK